MRRLPKTEANLTNAKISGMNVIRKVVPYLWPDSEPGVKLRVVLAVTMLVLAKVIAVITPLFYKWAVDHLGGEASGPAFFLVAGAVGLTVAYGFARLMNVGFQQLRDVI